MMFFVYLLIYLITGCFAGYLAGLFGVGGGIIIVPVLTFVFEAMNFSPDISIQLTIGTSMAAVAVTSIVSARTHSNNGNVDWKGMKILLPTVLIGVVIGALIGSYIPRRILMGIVIAFELSVAFLFLYETSVRKKVGEKNKEENHFQEKILHKLPILGTSSFLGATSSVVGIAGGTLFVPFLTLIGMGMRRAIGTAAALGIPIGTVAMIVYIITGLTSGKELPAYSIGFVYLPAFIGCIIGGFWTTKHGANLAKKMNVRGLKRAFALVLLAAAIKMIWGMM